MIFHACFQKPDRIETLDLRNNPSQLLEYSNLFDSSDSLNFGQRFGIRKAESWPARVDGCQTFDAWSKQTKAGDIPLKKGRKEGRKRTRPRLDRPAAKGKLSRGGKINDPLFITRMCFLLHKFTISIKVGSKFESWHLLLVNDSPSTNGGGKKHALDGVNFEEEEEEEVERWPCYAR